MTQSFTWKQGQYLAFIHNYTQINGCPPAQADLRQYFRATPPSIHDMILRLHEKGFIAREPGKARSLRVLVPESELPRLE